MFYHATTYSYSAKVWSSVCLAHPILIALFSNITDISGCDLFSVAIQQAVPISFIYSRNILLDLLWLHCYFHFAGSGIIFLQSNGTTNAKQANRTTTPTVTYVFVPHTMYRFLFISVLCTQLNENAKYSLHEFSNIKHLSLILPNFLALIYMHPSWLFCGFIYLFPNISPKSKFK